MAEAIVHKPAARLVEIFPLLHLRRQRRDKEARRPDEVGRLCSEEGNGMACYPKEVTLDETEQEKSNRGSDAVVTKWKIGTEQVAPPALTPLVTQTVDETYPLGRIYGYWVSADEANNFRLTWTSGVARSMLICLPVGGTIVVVLDFQSLNESMLAPTTSTIQIVNVAAGAAGKRYQAGVLLA